MNEFLNLNNLFTIGTDGAVEVELAPGELLQLGLQASDLILKFTDHCILGVLV